MTGGNISGNNADKIFYLDETEADIKGVTVTGNASIILDIENDSAKVTLTECTLGDNEPVKKEFDVFVETMGTLILSDCELGDTTYENKKRIDFGSGDVAGSIFGEGSFSMIVSLAALVVSVASFTLNVAGRRGKKQTTESN
jgi:hypothetical protein